MRQAVNLIDELTQIQHLKDEKVTFLHKLRKESEQYEQADHEKPKFWGGDGDTAPADYTTTEMIDKALHTIEEKNNRFPQYLRDLRSILDVVSFAGDQSVLSSTLHGQILKLYQ